MIRFIIVVCLLITGCNFSNAKENSDKKSLVGRETSKEVGDSIEELLVDEVEFESKEAATSFFLKFLSESPIGCINNYYFADNGFSDQTEDESFLVLDTKKDYVISFDVKNRENGIDVKKVPNSLDAEKIARFLAQISSNKDSMLNHMSYKVICDFTTYDGDKKKDIRKLSKNELFILEEKDNPEWIDFVGFWADCENMDFGSVPNCILLKFIPNSLNSKKFDVHFVGDSGFFRVFTFENINGQYILTKYKTGYSC